MLHDSSQQMASPLKPLATGACQKAIEGLGQAIQQVCEDSDDDELDCESWLDDLNAQWALISILEPLPFGGAGRKEAHDANVDHFCTQCPELCSQARRFGKVTLQ